jgi:catechol 2,3-dioxygenase-like lactoylglutathione lyase family enzyme
MGGIAVVGFEVVGLDHVQLAMPPGREAEAEAFYSGLLGFERIPKPEPMASRGGCWFATGPVAIHLGVEAEFRPARKAHPALVVRQAPDLIATLVAAGHEVRPNQDQPEGTGWYVDDPFGNRLELIEAGWAGGDTATPG